jgi:DUF4097 and DUF4098 domain-containing protein YvlB
VSSARRRGSSIFAGLLLILLGVLLLIYIFYPQLRLGHMIAVYWPVLLIVLGAAKLIEHFAAGKAARLPRSGPSGGEVVLLLALAIVLGSFVFRDWIHARFPDSVAEFPFGIAPSPFERSYSRTEAIAPQTIPPGAMVAIEIGRGKITVQGHAGNQLLMTAQKTVWGLSETSAETTLQQAHVQINRSGGLYRIWPQFGLGQRASVDLAVEAPASASVAASTARGDIRVANIDGRLQAHSGDGDVEVKNAGADVAVNLNQGDARIAGAAGNVRVYGRGNDVNISDVNGDASIEGPFDGSIHARNVARTLHCGLPWSAITIGQLNGTLETDLGDLSISGASGPVRIATHNTDIDVKNATGRIDILDAHGDIKVTLSTPPRENITITDDAGEVDVMLPPESNFELAAVSRSGDVRSDFEGGQLNVSNTDTSGQMTGQVGAPGGPRITIATTYGTIHLRKGHL